MGSCGKGCLTSSSKGQLFLSERISEVSGECPHNIEGEVHLYYEDNSFIHLWGRPNKMFGPQKTFEFFLHMFQE